ncbi:MAG: hypothetical protein KC978_04610 [Candidatus Omnitrophica bacterium]|nr:hypothetical protein [Candidatus Omnitrophota bacterium]
MERQSLGPSGANPVAEEQFRKGFELAKSGNIDEGILAVEAAIAVSPEEGRYHDLMGTLYAKKGLYEMAVAEWKRSIECDSDHAEVFRRIENAEKLKAHVQPKGEKWAWIGLVAVSLLFVLALAWGVFTVRNQGAMKQAVAEAEQKLSEVERDYVKKTDYEVVMDRANSLEDQLAALQGEVDAKNSQIAELQDESKYVPKENLQKEVENRYKVESELKLARERVSQLEMQLGAVGDATGAEVLTNKLNLKDEELAELRNNYKTLNEDRLRLEKSLATSNDRVVALEAQVDDLRAQFSEDTTGSLPIASVSGEMLFAPALADTFKAIVSIQEGNPDAALASLRGLEEKNPNTPGLKEAIKALSSEETVEATVEPTATATPTLQPTKRPTPQPTATKAPTPKPTWTPVPKPTGPIVPAKPRPIGGSSRSVAESRPQTPREAPAPTPKRDDSEERAKRLQQQKAAFTQQAYQAYRNRDFSRAKQLIDRAYRIDPNDQAVNQLRGAIERAMGG